jgi:hypothetical protein
VPWMEGEAAGGRIWQKAAVGVGRRWRDGVEAEGRGRAEEPVLDHRERWDQFSLTEHAVV